MKFNKLPRETALDPMDNIKKHFQTSFCNLLKTDVESGSKLYKIVYGFVIYNAVKNELWEIKAESYPNIDNLRSVQEYAEKQFEKLIQKKS